MGSPEKATNISFSVLKHNIRTHLLIFLQFLWHNPKELLKIYLRNICHDALSGMSSRLLFLLLGGHGGDTVIILILLILVVTHKHTTIAARTWYAYCVNLGHTLFPIITSRIIILFNICGNRRFIIFLVALLNFLAFLVFTWTQHALILISWTIILLHYPLLRLCIQLWWGVEIMRIECLLCWPIVARCRTEASFLATVAHLYDALIRCKEFIFVFIQNLLCYDLIVILVEERKYS